MLYFALIVLIYFVFMITGVYSCFLNDPILFIMNTLLFVYNFSLFFTGKLYHMRSGLDSFRVINCKPGSFLGTIFKLK